MLDAIGSPERAEDWLRAELNAGRRIMGMGHRVYRVRDPRAAVLERQVQQLQSSGETAEIAAKLRLARVIESTAERLLSERHSDRALRANVEFYTAVLLDAIGVPRDAFTLTFAVSRVCGWCAHVLEQRRTGRLIRPASRYVGTLAP
jgi:citrate synthase